MPTVSCSPCARPARPGTSAGDGLDAVVEALVEDREHLVAELARRCGRRRRCWWPRRRRPARPPGRGGVGTCVAVDGRRAGRPGRRRWCAATRVGPADVLALGEVEPHRRGLGPSTGRCGPGRGCWCVVPSEAVEGVLDPPLAVEVDLRDGVEVAVRAHSTRRKRVVGSSTSVSMRQRDGADLVGRRVTSKPSVEVLGVRGLGAAGAGRSITGRRRRRPGSATSPAGTWSGAA